MDERIPRGSRRQLPAMLLGGSERTQRYLCPLVRGPGGGQGRSMVTAKAAAGIPSLFLSEAEVVPAQA